MDDHLKDEILRRFRDLLLDLGEYVKVGDHELTTDDDIRLAVQRKDGPGRVEVVAQDSSEVFSIKIGDRYEYYMTAYDLDDKLEAVDDLIDTARHYLLNQFHERVYEDSKGSEVYRELHIGSGDNLFVLPGSASVLGSLGRHLARRVRDVHPPG